ncbi:MAG: hypothetical protein COA79_18595 [Planctomycetota bacterium]|nr:MAG: hypothetical protein COA79_18595 [Planctomycetota bacterium]
MALKQINKTFEHFIISPSNRLSLVAAKTVAESPSKVYNPLFISGAKGSGKTHILKAIEQSISENHPDLVIKSYDLEFFNDLYLHADTEELLKLFREETREGDVFLFDNLDYLEKFESTKEEFFHTFNDIFQKGNQVIITSSLNTKELINFPERLLSRLEWGLSTNLLTPVFETKLLIFEKFFEINQIKYEKSVLNFLAEKNEDNLNTLLDLAKNVIDIFQNSENQILDTKFIDTNLKEHKTEIDPLKIQQVISQLLNVSTLDMLSKSRVSKIVEARHIAIYLIRKLTNHTLKEVGILFGRRHHTTIMHAEEEIKTRCIEDKNFKFLIQNIIKQI